MVEVVAAEQHRDVVLLEHGRVRVACETSRRKKRVPGRAPVERGVHAPRRRDEPLEVRQPPGHRDSQTSRRRRKTPLEIGERRLERVTCIGEVRAIHEHSRRDDLVMKRRHLHLDTVVRHRPHAVEHMLLGRQRPGRAASG